jgi:hypothetical protein
MLIGVLNNKENSMRVYHLKGQHYISTFLVEFLTGTQKTSEKRVESLNDLYDEITKFKEN